MMIAGSDHFMNGEYDLLVDLLVLLCGQCAAL
jgi:hypothetical protein